MNEKISVVLISIFFSILMIGLFYMQHFIAPKFSQKYYRLIIMFLIAVVNLFIMDDYDALTPVYVFGPILKSFLFILASVLLFLGPIYQNYLIIEKMISRSPDKEKYIKLTIKSRITTLPIIDVVIGPILEELLYRYCNGNLWMNVEIKTWKIIFISPLIFGLAHFHHFFEASDLKHHWKPVLKRTLLQVGFSSLFGFWDQFCYVKTRGLLTCIIIHGFCNYMQFPDFAGAFNWPDQKQRKELLQVYILGIILFIIFTIILSLI